MMQLRNVISNLRVVIPKLKDDVEYSRMIDFFKDDLEQLLAWYQELQAYRDTGLTPEQVNLTEATLWKEQGLIARESDRGRGRWIICTDGDWKSETVCSLCGGVSPNGWHWKYCPHCGAKNRED